MIKIVKTVIQMELVQHVLKDIAQMQLEFVTLFVKMDKMVVKLVKEMHNKLFNQDVHIVRQDLKELMEDVKPYLIVLKELIIVKYVQLTKKIVVHVMLIIS